MITRRTKIQLLVFVVITLLGVTYVGARYAQLDRLFYDDSYEVTVHLAESGGLFAGAEVTYRGVTVGSVDSMVLTDQGVDAVLEVLNEYDDIPEESAAVVGNRSAVGEQYVELQPQVDDGPFLTEGSEVPVEMTTTPIRTETLLTNLSNTVSSIDKDAMRTTVSELGAAFGGTGEDLQRIIDTGNSFIEAADQNFDTTTKLIRDGDTVLRTQLDSEPALRTFADQLLLFSDTLVASDDDLRTVIDTGSGTVNQLRRLIEDNRVELGDLLNNLVTTGEIFVKRLPGVQQVLVLYPYVVEGGFTVVSPDPDTGLYDAHFGLIITDSRPCYGGYQGTDKRTPSDGSNRKMNEGARCTEPASATNARGSQNIPPRAAPGFDAPVASWDRTTGEVTWLRGTNPLADTGSVAQRTSAGAGVDGEDSGEETWSWLLGEPMGLD
ncbi:MAG: virulence factor Mce [Nocardioides sp.]|nr:virulence factor Mce [Nocardioides sp.]